MKKFLADLFQDGSGVWDLSRIMWAWAFVVIVHCALLAAFLKPESFLSNFAEIAGGVSALLVAGAGGVLLHNKSPN